MLKLIPTLPSPSFSIRCELIARRCSLTSSSGGQGGNTLASRAGRAPRHVVLALDFVVKLDDQGCIAGFAILGRREVNDAAAFIERTVGDSQR
jgi:hypothetical protein